MYNYYEEMQNDIRVYIGENYGEDTNILTEYDRDSFAEMLEDELWTVDAVTGNASGSYWCNGYKAEEALAGNWDLVAEALDAFGDSGVDAFRRGAEWCDVTVRCYVLGQAVCAVVDDYFDDLEWIVENGGQKYASIN